MTMIIFLVIFVFFESLNLRLIYISGSKILNGPIFVSILMILPIPISFIFWLIYDFLNIWT